MLCSGKFANLAYFHKKFGFKQVGNGEISTVKIYCIADVLSIEQFSNDCRKQLRDCDCYA